MASDIEAFVNADSTGATPTAPAAPDSDFYRWATGGDTADRLGVAVKAAQDREPETAGKVISLANQTGLPMDHVERNLDTVQKATAAASFDPADFQAKHPVTANWMADNPNHAAVVKDDIPAVSNLERTVQDYAAHETMGNIFKDAWTALKGEGAKTLSDAVKAPAFLYDLTKTMGDNARKYAAQLGPMGQLLAPVSMISSQMDPKAPGWTTNNPATRYLDEISGKQQAPEMSANAWNEIKSGSYARAGQIAAVQFVGSLPFLAAGTVGLLTGQPELAAGGLGVLAASGANAKNIEAGKEGEASTVDAALQGAIMGSGEALVPLGVVKKWGQAVFEQYGRDVTARVLGDMAKTLLSSAGVTAAEMSTMQIGNDLADWATGINPDAIHGVVGRAANAAVTGAVTGLALHGPAGLVAGYNRVADLPKAERARDFYTALGSDVEATKMRERLPDAQKELVSQMVKGSPVENVYVSPQAVDTFFQDKGIDPLKMMQQLGVLNEYNHAKQTGADIQIPLADWTQKLAGTGFHNGLADDIKFSPDDLSVNEAKAQADLKSAVDEAAKAQDQNPDAAAADNAKSESAAKVTETMKAKLQAAGFDDPTSTNYAKIYGAAFRSLGERAGADPMELFNRYGLQVRRPDEMAPTSETNFQQTGEGDGGITPGEPGNPEQPNVPLGADPSGSPLGSAPERAPQNQAEPVEQRLKRLEAVFPGPSFSSADSVRQDPNFSKLSLDALAVTEKYAKERGVQPSFEFAKKLWRELHDATKGVSDETATMDERKARAKALKEKYPDYSAEFSTLKNKIWLDQTEGFHGAFKRYGWIRPKAALDLENQSLEQAPAKPIPTDTPEFKNWFGDSKVVDENRKPLVVYHGTDAAFNEFKNMPPKTPFAWDDHSVGFFFSNNDAFVDQFGKNHMATFLSIENPKRYTWESYNRDLKKYGGDNVRRYAIEDGHDGIVVKGFNPRTDIYVAFKPEQIKSIHNRGTFDPNSPNILEQAAYHGTPHEVDQFSLQKIGTGEGHQAFGWGLYFASNKDVADYYRAKLTNNTGKEGRLYKVEIPDDGDYLEWNKVLADQPKLLKVAKTLGVEVDPYSDTGEDLYSRLEQKAIEGNKEAIRSKEMKMKDAARIASETLAKEGVPGIKYADAGSRNSENPSHNYVIFDDKLVKILEYEQSQKGGDAARGRIRFGSNRQFNIDLLKDADLSTFLHETGHFYLEVLRDIASDPSAAPDVQKDWSTILKWFGVENGDQIQREHHEQFARGFEAYLMEGKAPTPGLRAAFARFRDWLVKIYQNVSNLNVSLTPEVKQVFDRILATDQEMAAAEAEQDIRPLFDNPITFGMNEKEAESYQKLRDEARRSSVESMLEKTMKQLRREDMATYKDQREKVMQEIASQVNQQKEYVALSVLHTGKLPDGEPLPEALAGESMKLSRKVVENEYPALSLSIQKLGITLAKGGQHPDRAAEMFGFDSGSEMLQNLSKLEPREALIDRLTNAEMQKRYPDLMRDPAKLRTEAIKSLHDPKASATLIRKDMEYLTSQEFAKFKGLVKRINRPVPTIDTVRTWVENVVGERKVRDLKPSLYQVAERKSSREAMDHLLAGRFNQAFEAKRRELLNHELYRAASNAVEDVDKIVDYMKKFDRPSIRESIGKAGGDYLEQIDAIRERFDFSRSTTLRAIDKRKSLLAWMQEQQDQGLDVDLPESLLNEAGTQSYKDTPFQQLSDIRDTVKTIEHLARLKNKLIASEKAREFGEARDAVVGAIEAHHDTTQKKADFVPSRLDKLVGAIKRIDAAHTRMEFLFEYLDGNKPQGPVWQTLFKPFADAENAENAKMKEVVKNLNSLFGEYTRRERAEWFLHKEFIPETASDKFKGHFTKSNILAVALNLGNAYNYDALKEGYGWTDDQVKAIVNRLDQRDWKVVQGIWDYIDSFWPEVSEMERKLNGLTPEKVQARGFETKFGTMKGGYYPIKFDPNLPFAKSFKQAALDEKANIQEAFGGNWARAMTAHGHTTERTNTGGKPLLLTLGVLTNHLSQVVHDLTHRPAVVDAYRLINDEKIRQTVINAAGREMYDQLNPWLKGIAGDRRGEPMNYVEGLLTRARTGATVVNLGFKLTSAIVQTLGYMNTVSDIGVKYAAHGLKEAFLDPRKIGPNWRFIAERSEMMKDRVSNFDRDVRDAVKRLNIEGTQTGPISVAQSFINEHLPDFFHFTGVMDLATSIPTWLGAYRKAMDGGLENVEKGDEKRAIDYADSVVRNTQAAGAAKDLASIQRGSPLMRLFTMFYSSMAVQYNNFGRAYGRYKLDKNFGKLVGAAALLWFLPAVMEPMLRGRGPGDDEDSDKLTSWFLNNEITYPFGSVVFLRDIVNGLDKRGFEASPAFGAFEEGQKVAQAGIKAATGVASGDGYDFTRSDLKAAVMAGSYAFALPGRQTWQTLEYFYDWMTGEEEPANPAEGLYRALVTGKKRD